MAHEIKEDLKIGTEIAKQNKIKKVKKDHLHLKKKADMNILFMTRPIIVRNNWRMPTYPKAAFFSTEKEPELARLEHIHMDNMEASESKDGLVTETQLHIVSGHIADI